MKEAVAPESNPVSRRDLIIGLAAGVAACAPGLAAAQAPARGEAPATHQPARDYTAGAPPVGYPDPDIITIDPAFNALRVNNTAIHRLWTGAMWSEGPAWCNQGRFLVWSDIPNNRQLRWLEENGQVSVFRSPSNNSNGNSYDFQGRQIACEHALRRLVRYEHDGTVSVIADAFGGMRLNSPNDVAPHPDGSYWFTDPPAGFQLYQGAPEPEGPGNPVGQLRSRVGQLAGVGMWKREIPTANVYRADPSGKVDMVVKQTDLPGNPNGILFSPDYKRLYIIANGGLVSCDLDGHPRGNPQRVLRLHGRRREVPHRRCPGGRARQRVGRYAHQRGARHELRRRHRVVARGQADRTNPPPGDLRQRRLRRSEAQPAVHDRRTVALRGLHGDAGRIAGLDPKQAAGSGQLAVGGSGDPPSQNPIFEEPDGRSSPS